MESFSGVESQKPSLILASQQHVVSHLNVKFRLLSKINDLVTEHDIFVIFITDCTAPFTVGVVTDAIDETDNSAPAVGARGLCLEYTQIPCV